MKWSERKPDMNGVFIKIQCETPLGLFEIEWDRYHNDPKYYPLLQGRRIFHPFSTLENAQARVSQYLHEKLEELKIFLK